MTYSYVICMVDATCLCKHLVDKVVPATVMSNNTTKCHSPSQCHCRRMSSRLPSSSLQCSHALRVSNVSTSSYVDSSVQTTCREAPDEAQGWGGGCCSYGRQGYGIQARQISHRDNTWEIANIYLSSWKDHFWINQLWITIGGGGILLTSWWNNLRIDNWVSMLMVHRFAKFAASTCR